MESVFLEMVYKNWKSEIGLPIAVYNGKMGDEIVEMLSKFYEFLFGEKTLQTTIHAQMGDMVICQVPIEHPPTQGYHYAIEKLIAIQRHRGFNAVVVCPPKIFDHVKERSIGISYFNQGFDDKNDRIMMESNIDGAIRFTTTLSEIETALERPKDVNYIIEQIIKKRHVFGYQIDNTFIAKNCAFIAESVNSAGGTIPKEFGPLIEKSIQFEGGKILL